MNSGDKNAEILRRLSAIEPSAVVKAVLTGQEGGTLKPEGESFVFETRRGKQAFHTRVSADELPEALSGRMRAGDTLSVVTEGRTYDFKLTKKGRPLFNAYKNDAKRGKGGSKNYLIEAGKPLAPLVDLGVMTTDGRVVNQMYDKFKQINRFVELIDDVTDGCDKLRILDFGCGKSYLTFVVYHYLKNVKNIDADVTGLDLKADVVAKCNAAARRYGYESLRFETGDISDYAADGIDMVIALHACDTATDAALYNGIRAGAKIIVSVPCCQHEANASMTGKDLMTRYGIVRERFAALATDAVRANLLTFAGYRTQILEFVDLAHSPKNLMLRAVKAEISDEARQSALAEAEELMMRYGFSQTLHTLLTKDASAAETRGRRK